MAYLTYPRALSCGVAIVLAMAVAAASPQQQPASASDPQGTHDAALIAANQLRKDRRFDEAQAAYESLLEAARLSGDVRLEARSLIGLGNVQVTTGRYPQARELASQGLELAVKSSSQDDIGRANLVLSVAAEYMGDLPEARTRAEQSLSAFESAGDSIGRAQATLSLLRVKTMDTSEVERLSERAVADAHAGGDISLEASALHQIGDGYFAVGEYPAALTTLEQAAALYASSHDDGNLGTVYNSVGRVYRAHGQLAMALEYQLKALALNEHAPEARLQMQSLNAVSAVYLMLGEAVKARTYAERALVAAEKTGSPRLQDFISANLANILAALGEFGRAAVLFQGVIERDLDPNITMRYAQLSHVLRKLGRYDDALRAAESAVERCLAGVIQADTDCLAAFEARAYAHLDRDQAADALRDITTVLDRVESARSKLVPSDFLKREYVNSQESAYSFAIRLQLRQGRAAEALETAELARSRAFIDLLASRDVKLSSPAASSLPSLTLRGGAPSVTSGDLSSVAVAPPSRVADLAQTAKRLKSTIITYWTTSDAVFIWVVTPDGRVRSTRVDILASKLAALTRATVPFDTPSTGAQTLIATRGGEQFPLDAPRGDAWRELYDVLIRPVRDSLPTDSGSMLTIVPHGPLAGLPFAALRDERGRYLLEDFTLHYAPAGAVLQFTAGERHLDGRAGSVLIVADPVAPKTALLGRSLPSLPGAREEARAISGQVPAARRMVLMGAEATEVRVAAAVEKAAVVHFATHAVARDNAPFESFLALGADSTDDGLMTAEEVYRLNLRADLVVLSACRSGGARVSGDGIAAFARAFIYAGTPSIIASLWDVPDVSTSTLVSNFYRAWWAGASKSRALRSAQLAMLRDLRLGRITVATAAGPVAVPEHPIFWAGLVLIGEPD